MLTIEQTWFEGWGDQWPLWLARYGDGPARVALCPFDAAVLALAAAIAPVALEAAA